MTAITTRVNEPVLHTGLKKYRPKKSWMRHFAKRAAVAAILSDQPEITSGYGQHVLLMKRAERDGDPWSGHMSFPGGRSEENDDSIRYTAIRECYEEVGVDLNQKGHYITRLSDIQARPIRLNKRPFIVTPFVFHLNGAPNWALDPKEVDEVVWVPISYLKSSENRGTMIWEKGSLSLTMPCYHYEDYTIWGLTLRMLDELVSIV